MGSALRRTGSTTRWRRIRAYVLARDRGVCWLCGHDGANSVDHVVPRERGGTDDPSNLRAAHLHCNARRGVRPPAAPETTRTY